VKDRTKSSEVLVGLIRVREHCAFAWEEPATGGRRVAIATQTHCDDCVAELRRRGYVVRAEDEKEAPPHWR
jgi:hypothetical protein